MAVLTRSWQTRLLLWILCTSGNLKQLQSMHNTPPMVLKLRIELTALTKVIEFDKKCKSECLSSIGQATGLEPRTLYVAWRPSVNDDPNRPGWHD